MANWLATLFDHGEAIVSGPPIHQGSDDSAALSVLSRAFETLKLDVAGPPLTFDPAIAISAARYVAATCWNLFGPNPTDIPLDLPKLGEPRTPAAHLSGDTTLRYLPSVYRRAALRAENDPLGSAVAAVLRQWPLSGVLANLPGAPNGDVRFAGHAGLQLLYAERLIEHENAAWMPASGGALERLELVYSQRGKPLPIAAPVNLESPDE